MKTIKELASFEIEETSSCPFDLFFIKKIHKIPGEKIYLSEINLETGRATPKGCVFVYWVKNGIYGFFRMSKEILSEPDAREFILDEIEAQKDDLKQRQNKPEQ